MRDKVAALKVPRLPTAWTTSNFVRSCDPLPAQRLLPIDRSKLAQRTVLWTIIGFSVKGTVTLAIMAYSAFVVWSGDNAENELFSHALALVVVTALIGALCMTRYIARRNAAARTPERSRR
ncbi:MAG: hypothetical protein V4550_07215 [Gemmatimonadota bacterium]